MGLGGAPPAKLLVLGSRAHQPASHVPWPVIGPGGCVSRFWPMEESLLGLPDEVSSADKGDNKTGLFSSPDPSLLSVTASQPTNLLGDDEGPGGRRLTVPGTVLGALQKPTHSLPHEVGAITLLILLMGTPRHGEKGESSALVADDANLPPQPLQGSVRVTAAQLPLSHSLQPLCRLSSSDLFASWARAQPLPFAWITLLTRLSHYGILVQMFPPPRDMFGWGRR